MLVCDFCRNPLEGAALSKDGKLFHDKCADKAEVKAPAAINITAAGQIKTHTTMVQIFRTDHHNIHRVRGVLESKGGFITLPATMHEIVDYYMTNKMSVKK